MADNRPSSFQRLVFAYRPEGFNAIGGLYKIAQEIVNWLEAQPCQPRMATLSRASSGLLKHTTHCRQLQSGDHLVIVGCDSPWAYGIAIVSRLRGLPVSWLPSFHDPKYAIHHNKARFAQAALKGLQLLGIIVYAQTKYEQQLLRCSWVDHCFLSSHGLPAKIRQELQASRPSSSSSNRPIDLLFLGRPTRQKGWNKFLRITQSLNLQCAAITPTLPNEINGNISLYIQPSDQIVESLLNKSKLVLIPANYESFGIAQLEAVAAGCIVPILGRWPLWDDFKHLNWQHLDLEEISRQCLLLCQNTRQRLELAEQQFVYIQGHAIRHAPILPKLRSETMIFI